MIILKKSFKTVHAAQNKTKITFQSNKSICIFI